MRSDESARCLEKLQNIGQQMIQAKKSSRGLRFTSDRCVDAGYPPQDTPMNSDRRVLKRVGENSLQGLAELLKRAKDSLATDIASVKST